MGKMMKKSNQTVELFNEVYQDEVTMVTQRFLLIRFCILRQPPPIAIIRFKLASD